MILPLHGLLGDYTNATGNSVGSLGTTGCDIFQKESFTVSYCSEELEDKSKPHLILDFLGSHFL